MSELLKIYDLHKRCDFADKDVKRSFERSCNPKNVTEIIELLHNNSMELDDLNAYKSLAIELANRKGFDSVAKAIDSIDHGGSMTPIRTIRKRYKSDYALSKELGITPAQLKRFLDRDALFNQYTGEFYQVAKTKANIGEYKGDL